MSSALNSFVPPLGHLIDEVRCVKLFFSFTAAEENHMRPVDLDWNSLALQEVFDTTQHRHRRQLQHQHSGTRRCYSLVHPGPKLGLARRTACHNTDFRFAAPSANYTSAQRHTQYQPGRRSPQCAQAPCACQHGD